MSTTLTHRNPRRIGVGIGIAILILVVAGVGLNRQHRVTEVPKTTAEIKTVEAGQAGPVGDLTITPTAMKLADINIGLVKREVVNEKLALSGVIQPTSNGIAKVTARIPGKATKVFVSVGDQVKTGQTLALLESQDLATAQAAYKQAQSKLAASRANFDRQTKLAKLGSFGNPKMEEAQRAAVTAQNDVDAANGQVRSAQAEVARAESELGSLQAEVEQAESKSKVVQSRFNRAETLIKSGLISRQEWEQAEADRGRAEADILVARAKLKQGGATIESAKAGLASAQSALESARKRLGIETASLARERKVFDGGYATNRELVDAEADLREAKLQVDATAQAVKLTGGTPGGGNTIPITSPITGRIQERALTLGEMVDSEHSLFTVINLDQVWAEIPIAPREVGLAKEGEAVELTSETLPGKVFRGHVASVGSSADSTTRAISIRVILENKDGALRPGSYVKGNLVTAVRHEQIVVPEGAIQDHTNKKTLYVALGKQGAFEVRHVILGARQNGMVEVVDGLKGDERIATSGTFYLKSEALKSSLADGCCGGGA